MNRERCSRLRVGRKMVGAWSASAAWLAETGIPVLRTLAKMDELITLLRQRKVGSAVVESKTVNTLHRLVKRARGEIRRPA